MTDPVPHVYTAINEVTAAISVTGISKDRSNNQQGYNFRGIDDVYNNLSGLLAASKLCIIPRVVSRQVTERQTKSGGALFYVVVEVEYDLVSAVDGSYCLGRAIGEAMDSADKATNKAMSAAYKYFCIMAFCIPTAGDNDADSTTHEVAPQPASLEDQWYRRLVADYDKQDPIALTRGWEVLKGDKPLAQTVWRRLKATAPLVAEKITALTTPAQPQLPIENAGATPVYASQVAPGPVTAHGDPQGTHAASVYDGPQDDFNDDIPF